MKKILIILLLVSMPCFAEETDSLNLPDKWAFGRLLGDMFDFSKSVRIQNIIYINYGTGLPYFSHDKCNEKFALIYPASFRYGFFRNYNKFKNPVQRYTASEYIGVENISSHFKPKDWLKDGNTISVWRFLGGFENGWGIGSKSRMLTFNHGSYLGWTNVDIEFPSQDSNNQKVLVQYDNKYKFSTGFDASVNYTLANTFLFRVSYSRSIIYPEVKFFGWLPGVTAELLIQRAIDLYSANLYEKYGGWYSFANFIVKNGISYFLYQLRENNMYFPIKSDKPMNLQNFSVGIGLIF